MDRPQVAQQLGRALLCHAACLDIIPPHTPGEGQNRYQVGRPWDQIY